MVYVESPERAGERVARLDPRPRPGPASALVLSVVPRWVRILLPLQFFFYSNPPNLPLIYPCSKPYFTLMPPYSNPLPTLSSSA